MSTKSKKSDVWCEVETLKKLFGDQQKQMQALQQQLAKMQEQLIKQNKELKRLRRRNKPTTEVEPDYYGKDSNHSIFFSGDNSASLMKQKELDGGYNVAIGEHALAERHIQGNEEQVRPTSLTGNLSPTKNRTSKPSLTSNTAIGWRSLWRHADDYGTAVGYAAGMNHRSGKYITAMGAGALQDHINGADNTAVGFASLRYSLEGNENTGIGSNALRSSQGSRNTALGSQAGYQPTKGDCNVFVGHMAGLSSTSVEGNNNTCLGAQAGRSLRAGDGNTFLGFRSGVSAAIAQDPEQELEYASAIGCQAQVGASNVMCLGGLDGTYASVNVGIGIANPQAKLQVPGSIALKENTDASDLAQIGGYTQLCVVKHLDKLRLLVSYSDGTSTML